MTKPCKHNYWHGKTIAVLSKVDGLKAKRLCKGADVHLCCLCLVDLYSCFFLYCANVSSCFKHIYNPMLLC
jgi:hypothetical protein